MTLFVDVNDLAKIASQLGNAQFMQGLLSYLEHDYVRWESYDKSPRTAAHSNVGVIELMPVADAEHYAFKYVNGHPQNPQHGMSTVMAFGALSDVATGYPYLLSELTLTTAFRTAATSVMAAKALARKNANSMAMIGCGAQSEFQAIAFHSVLGINELRIFDVDKRSMKKLRQHLRPFKHLKVISADSAKVCVSGADIVTTVTADKKWATILTPDMIESGMHINAVGGDCPGKTELHIDVLLTGKIFIEHEPQSRVEGDIQQLPQAHPVYPLWKVIAGQAKGRDSNSQITIFDSVGFALEDLSALRFVYDQARRLGIGRVINLVPTLGNPKDLFSLTQHQQGEEQVNKAA